MRETFESTFIASFSDYC